MMSTPPTHCPVPLTNPEKEVGAFRTEDPLVAAARAKLANPPRKPLANLIWELYGKYYMVSMMKKARRVLSLASVTAAIRSRCFDKLAPPGYDLRGLVESIVVIEFPDDFAFCDDPDSKFSPPPTPTLPLHTCLLTCFG